ncbi:hypothetical protein B0H10DRAFT_2230052 [Mycena sp. CBHHK59/15]|nr:hypothetical protein B0H10DRAFT_2230052 [Mycena sp. CBHHK59/15]
MNPDLTAPTLPICARFDGHIRGGDQHIFGVHYGDPTFILNMPNPSEAPSPEHNLMDADFYHTTWTSPHMPYLILLPRYSPFYGPLFRRLHFTHGTIPIEVHDGGWCLNPCLRQEWSQLEWALRSVLRAMAHVHPGAVQEGLILHGWPTQYGYHISRRNRQAALVVSMRARDAFLPLMAAITMMFLALQERLGKSEESWRMSVIKLSGVHPQWFADLESSAVGDMSIERLGGIIDLVLLDDQTRTRRIPMEWLLTLVVGKLPVPLYFHWGKIDRVPDFPIPWALKEQKLFPDHLEIVYLRGLPGRIAFSGWRFQGGAWHSRRDTDPYLEPSQPPVNTPHTAPPIDDSARNAHGNFPPAERDSGPTAPPIDDSNARGNFPPVERDSGQKEGETIWQFIARRNAHNQKRAERESDQARSSRLAREANAAKGAAPGKKGARVFIWHEEEGDFFIRRATNRDIAADEWDNFTANQRIYDGFSNVWDLCTALASDEEAENSDDEREQSITGEEGEEFPDLPGISNTLLPEDEIGIHSTVDDLQHAYGLDRETQDDGVDDQYEPYHVMDEVPYSRFGFTTPIAPSQYQESLREDWYRRSVGDEEWPGLKAAKYTHLSAMLAYLAKARSLDEIPRELLDLRQDTADITGPWMVDVK